MQLQNYEEIVGILDKIEIHKKQGVVTLIFTFKKKIDLPLNACDKEILVSCIGRRIAVLRLDGEFKFRTVQNKDSEV